MALTLFRGAMGRGKTLSLTYQALRNYLYMRDCDRCRTRFNFIEERGSCPQCAGKDFHRFPIYSNYSLAFPHIKINELEEMEHIRNGFVAIDEIWRYANSRESMRKRNKWVSLILAQSRKMEFELGFTAQNERQVDIWIRRVTDLIAVPNIDKKKGTCSILFFSYYDSPQPFTMSNFIKRFRFPIEPVFKLYNTWEVIEEKELKEETRKRAIQEIRDEAKLRREEEDERYERED